MADSDSIVREATPEDLPAICALGEAVNALHHEVWPQVFAEPGDPLRHAAHWRQSIAAEQATVFVVEQAAEAWARQRGAPDIRLNVWAFNQRALALYEELGYEVRSQVLGKRLG